MSTETIITIWCIMLAAFVLTWSFRSRAVRAEAALSRVETEIERSTHMTAGQLVFREPDVSTIVADSFEMNGWSLAPKSIRQRFNESPLTFMGCATVETMDIVALKHFMRGVEDGAIERQLDAIDAAYEKLDAIPGKKVSK